MAHDSTVAKDAPAAHLTDLQTINPGTSPVVLPIQTAVNGPGTSLASQATVAQLLTLLTDVHDPQPGSWSVDQTQNPKVLTFTRIGGGVLAVFQVTKSLQ